MKLMKIDGIKTVQVWNYSGDKENRFTVCKDKRDNRREESSKYL